MMNKTLTLTEYLDNINPDGLKYATIESLKARIKEDLRFSSITRGAGGQICGMPPTDVVGFHEGLGFRMQLWPSQRSMLKAKNTISELFDLYLDELLK